MASNAVTVTRRAGSIAEAMQVIRDIENRAENPPLTEPLKVAAEMVRLRTLLNFVNSEDPEGRPWAPLKYRDGVPLILTGLMLTKAVEAGSSPRITPNEMLIEVPEPEYNLFHLFGTKIIPARPWLGINEEMIDDLAGGTADYVMNFAIEDQQ